MNFAERAFRYLFRKKGKAIILFWVLLITETMILSTVTILRASEVARIELLGKSKAKLLIEREKAEIAAKNWGIGKIDTDYRNC